MNQCRTEACVNPAKAARRLWCQPCESAKWPRRSRTCEACAKPYVPSYGGQRTCGRECGRKIYSRRPKPPRTCSECPTEIGRPRVVCSAVCAERRRIRRDKRAREMAQAGRPAPQCPCGTAIPENRRRCDDCLAASERSARKLAKVRRRARCRYVEHEPYTLAEIARRDQYRCGICGGAVAMAEQVPSLDAPTIDHILPLAAGGTDTPTNVQLAHFLCNSRKGARVGEVG